MNTVLLREREEENIDAASTGSLTCPIYQSGHPVCWESCASRTYKRVARLLLSLLPFDRSITECAGLWYFFFFVQLLSRPIYIFTRSRKSFREEGRESVFPFPVAGQRTEKVSDASSSAVWVRERKKERERKGKSVEKRKRNERKGVCLIQYVCNSKIKYVKLLKLYA